MKPSVKRGATLCSRKQKQFEGICASSQSAAGSLFAVCRSLFVVVSIRMNLRAGSRPASQPASQPASKPVRQLPFIKVNWGKIKLDQSNKGALCSRNLNWHSMGCQFGAAIALKLGSLAASDTPNTIQASDGRSNSGRKRGRGFTLNSRPTFTGGNLKL